MVHTRLFLNLGLIFMLLLCGRSDGYGEPSVSIAAIADRTVVQRDAGFGSFEANGAFTGSPSGIQVRVVDSTRTKEIRTWKNATITAATKKWQITLDRIPEGGWYFAEARYEGQTTAPTKSAGRFGVGMIIIMTGQSNMQTFCVSYAPAGGKTIEPHPLTAFSPFRSGQWDVPPIRAGKGRGDVLMANIIARALGIPVGVINCSAGSAFISEYVGDVQAYNRDLTQILADALRFAGGDVEMILWHQGFSDFYNDYRGRPTVTPESLKTYLRHHGWDEFENRAAAGQLQHIPYFEKLKRLHAQISKGIKRKNVPFLCGVKGRSLNAAHMENPQAYNVIKNPPYDWSLARSGQVDCVRWSQMAFVKELPYGRPLASSVDLRFKDFAHYQLEELFILSSRFAQSVLHTVGKEAYSGGGPKLMAEQALFYGGGGIYLRVKHEGGSKLVLPFPGKPIEGFEVRRPGSTEALAIKKISLLQPNGIFIELKNQPPGDLLVTYLSGVSPISDVRPGGLSNSPPEFVNPAPPGNILYDNAALPEGNTRPGLPVNGSLGCIRVSQTSKVFPGAFSKVPRMALDLPKLVTSPTMTMRYSIMEDSHVSLRLYDSHGRHAMLLASGRHAPGIHYARLPTKALASGLYIARLRADEMVLSKRTVLIK